MEIKNNKLIIKLKRSEFFKTIITFESNFENGQNTFSFNDYDSLQSTIKDINDIDSCIIASPIINVLDDLNVEIIIDSKVSEKINNLSYFDIKGIIGEVVYIILEGEIYITENTTKIFN